MRRLLILLLAFAMTVLGAVSSDQARAEFQNTGGSAPPQSDSYPPSATAPADPDYKAPPGGPVVDVGAAPIVVIATAKSAKSAWSADHTHIYTDTTFDLDRTDRGSTEQTFVVRAIGGAVDGMREHRQGEAQFAPRQKYRLFLLPQGGGVYVAKGGSDGAQIPTSASAAGAAQPMAAQSDCRESYAYPGPSGQMFCYLGAAWRPLKFPIVYRIHDNSGVSGAAAAVKDAFNSWVRVTNSTLEYRYGGTTSISSAAADGINVVMWNDLSNLNNPVAVTGWQYASIGTQGSMIQFDIEYNTQFSWAVGAVAGKYDIASVGRHEVGHTLGLTHIYDCNQIMGYSDPSHGCIPPGQVVGLGAGDIAGVRFLYPSLKTDLFLYKPTSGTTYEEIADGSGSWNGAAGPTLPIDHTVVPGDLNCPQSPFSSAPSCDSLTDLLMYKYTPDVTSCLPVIGCSTTIGNDVVSRYFNNGSGGWASAGDPYTRSPGGVMIPGYFDGCLGCPIPSSGQGTGNPQVTDFLRYNPDDAHEVTTESSDGEGHLYENVGPIWSAGWNITPGYFNGDLCTDYFLYKPGGGTTYVELSDCDGEFTGTSGPSFSGGWSVYPAHLNADGYTDLFLYKPSNGDSYVELANGSGGWSGVAGPTFSAGWTVTTGYLDHWASTGQPDATQNPLTDLFLYKPSNGASYVEFADGSGGWSGVAGPTFSSGWSVYSGNFDADDLIDVFLYKPNSGSTYVEQADGSGGWTGTAGPTFSTGWTVTTGYFDAT